MRLFACVHVCVFACVHVCVYVCVCVCVRAYTRLTTKRLSQHHRPQVENAEMVHKQFETRTATLNAQVWGGGGERGEGGKGGS